MSTAALIDRLTAEGYRLRLRPEGGVRIAPPPPADLLAELRRHRDDIEAELRRRAGGDGSSGGLPVRAPVPCSAPDSVAAAGELAACAREGELLARVRTGLGPEIDGALWRVLDRVLAARDLPLAERLWRHVVGADRRGIYSRLVGWLRALDSASDIARVRALVDAGPGSHGYHDAHEPLRGAR